MKSARKIKDIDQSLISSTNPLLKRNTFDFSYFHLNKYECP